jgi:hypothetical protein
VLVLVMPPAANVAIEEGFAQAPALKGLLKSDCLPTGLCWRQWCLLLGSMTARVNDRFVAEAFAVPGDVE